MTFFIASLNDDSPFIHSRSGFPTRSITLMIASNDHLVILSSNGKICLSANFNIGVTIGFIHLDHTYPIAYPSMYAPFGVKKNAESAVVAALVNVPKTVPVSSISFAIGFLMKLSHIPLTRYPIGFSKNFPTQNIGLSKKFHSPLNSSFIGLTTNDLNHDIGFANFAIAVAFLSCGIKLIMLELLLVSSILSCRELTSFLIVSVVRLKPAVIDQIASV